MLSNYYKLNKDLYIYKNRSLFFKNQENDNIYKNNLIILLSNNKDYFNDIIKSNIFVNKYIKGYFYPKIDKLQSVRNKKIDSNNQVLKYKEIESKYDSIKYRKLRLSMYNNFNSYFDCYEYINLFNTTYESKKTFQSKVSLIEPFLKELIERFEGYDNLIIPIIPNESITIGKSWNIENLLYYIIKNKIFSDTLLLSKFIFIVTNKSGSLMFKFKITDTFDLLRYKKLVNLIVKINNAEKLSSDEQDLIDGIKNNNEPNITINKSSVTSSSDSSENNFTYSLTDEVNDDEQIEISNIENNDDELDDLYSAIDNLQSSDEVLVDRKKLKIIQSKQEKLVVKVNGKNVKLNDVINDHTFEDLDYEDINSNVVNEEVKKSSLKEFDKSYCKYQKEKDLLKMITAFNNDPECPLYVSKIEKEDTSDSFNKKETYSFTLEDTYGKKHNIKVDVPIIIDNSFMYINDGKKSLGKQLITIPIIKTKPAEVVLSTNYNKMFMYRVGQKVSANLDKMKKFFKTDASKFHELKLKMGSCKGVNKDYQSTIEYDELSKIIISLKLNKFLLNFNRKEVDNVVAEKFDINLSKVLDNKYKYLLGYNLNINSLYVVDSNESLVYEVDIRNKIINTFKSIYDLILHQFKLSNNETLYKSLLNQKVSKKFMFTRVKISNEYIPTGIIMGFYFGLEKVLNAYNVEYEFTEKRKKLDDDEISDYNVIQFNDGFLYYNNNKFRYALLLNGLLEMPTKEINFADMNKASTYLDYFELAYNSRNKAKGFKNNLDFILDPKTIEVLNELKLPNTLLTVMLYCNTLLENNSFTPINSMSNYRLRSVEIVNCTLYKIMADSIKEYRDLHKAGRSEAKINIPQDKLLKTLIDSPIVDDYSILSPVLEFEKLGTTNYKGLSGTNLDQAFTIPMRSYDKSMVGLLGMSSPDSNKVGVVRQLSYNPKVKNTLGIIDQDKSVDEMSATSLFTPAELLNPYTSLHADPPRIG